MRPVAATEVSLAEFFAGRPDAEQVYEAVQGLMERIGPFTVQVTRSQIAFRRRTGSTHLWLPGRWLKNPASEAVLSIALRQPDPSPRFKEVVHPAEGVWMHHLEVRLSGDLDSEVEAWLREAYESAG